MTTIYVDADACPVKEETLRVAERHGLLTYIVSNSGMRVPRSPLVRQMIVPEGPDAADDWIADHIGRAEICVTNDIPLAGRCLKEGAFAIKPNGNTFTNDNIGMALATREIMEGIRNAGEMTGGPPLFSKADRSKFLDRMEMIVQEARKS